MKLRQAKKIVRKWEAHKESGLKRGTLQRAFRKIGEDFRHYDRKVWGDEDTEAFYDSMFDWAFIE